MIALAWKKIPYISKHLKVLTEPRETRNPEFGLINPRCKTPTFVDNDGTIIIEDMTIFSISSTFPQTLRNIDQAISPNWNGHNKL